MEDLNSFAVQNPAGDLWSYFRKALRDYKAECTMCTADPKVETRSRLRLFFTDVVCINTSTSIIA